MPKKVKMDGTPGPDILEGGNFQDIIDGFAGNDQITGGNQHDSLNGGADDDTVSGNNGKDFVDGGGDSDVVAGNNGKDVLVAGPATEPEDDDPIPNGEDIEGDDGNVSGSDDLPGGDEGDEGGEGGVGQNVVMGGNGKDLIYSSFDFEAGGSEAYNDIMTGGRAPDTFVFFASHGSDVITDFFKDTIDLTALDNLTGFGDLIVKADDNGDAVIDTGEGTITLEGVTMAEVNADMFLF